MYKTSHQSKKTKASFTPSSTSFNVCGIEGFLLLLAALLFSIVIFPMLMAPDGDSKIEHALARTHFDLRGLTVSCGYPVDGERECSIGKTGETTSSKITVTASGDALPAHYHVYRNEAGKIRVRTDLKGEFMDLTTAQTRLSNEVHMIVAQYLEREKNRKPIQSYLALTEAEKAHNLASYQ